MNARLGFQDRAWLLCTVTCLLWCLPARLQAESTTDAESRQSDTTADPQSNLKSAIQQELEELYQRVGKQAPNMMRSTGTIPKTGAGAARLRITSPSRTKIGDGSASRNKRLSSAATNANGKRVSPQAKQRLKTRQPETRQTAARDGGAVTAGTAAITDGLTEIQRELQQLYEKDGKQMPTVNFSELSQRARQTRAQLQQQTAAGKATLEARQTRHPVRTNPPAKRRLGLLQRLNPFRARGARTNHPNVRRRAMRRRQLSDPTQRRISTPTQAASSAEDQNTESAARPRLLPSFLRLPAVRNSVARPIDPQEIVAQPAHSADSSVESVGDTSAVDATPEGEFAADADAAAGDETLAVDDGGISSPVDEEETARAHLKDFANPFTELSEAEADIARDQENPFTGLTLDAVEIPADVDDKDAADGHEAADGKDVTVAGSESSRPDSDTQQTDADETQEETKIVDDSNVPNSFNEAKDEKKLSRPESTRMNKLAQIARRVDKSGLKGFCPVVLRDHRDLVDAKPEHVSYYESKRYQFSSAEAKAKFDAHPELYAPVSSGMDILVQAASDEDVEGKLDYAVWFRNRLYLFSSSETMHAFIEQPARYAVDED